MNYPADQTIEWEPAAALVHDFIMLIEKYEIAAGEANYRYWHSRILELSPSMEKLSGAIEPGYKEQGRFDGEHPSLLRGGDYVPLLWDKAKQAAYRLKGIIENRQRHESIFRPAGPSLPAAGFHSWVWDVAKNL